MQTHIPTAFLCHTALSAIPPGCWCCSTAPAGRMPRGISAKLYLPGAVWAAEWLIHLSEPIAAPQEVHSLPTLLAIIILFSHSFQYSVYLPSDSGRCSGCLTVFSLPQAEPDSFWHWRMNDACFCRPACPLLLSCKNKWSAAWHSWVHCVEQGRETISSFSHISGSQRL